MEKLRLLITDDEPGMRLGVERVLRDFTVPLPENGGEIGFDIELAETGEEALEKIQAAPPHILLLDHKLPGMDGLEVLDHLTPVDENMLVIMITAYASIETAVTATKTGAYDFLPKPFTPDELRNTIRKAARQIILTEQARKLAEEKKRVRFEFIRVLGHELKAPINAVEGYINIVRSKTAGENPALYDQMLDRSVARIHDMRKLIVDLLDMTRIESGTRVRTLEEMDLQAAMENAIELVKADAEERSISLSLQGETSLPIKADSTEIAMALNNIVSNAVKYNRENGSITITLAKDNDGASRIEVSDTGIGMTPEESAKLFKDFSRIKNRKTMNIPGSGLGLSVVKKIAEIYGGDVTVHSEPDVGSTFTLTLHSLSFDAEEA